MGIKANSKGTARVLHELSQYESLEDEYDESVAVSLTTKALQRADPSITSSDTQSTVKVFRLMMTGNVDIAAEGQHAMSKADNAANEILTGLRDTVCSGDDGDIVWSEDDD